MEAFGIGTKLNGGETEACALKSGACAEQVRTGAEWTHGSIHKHAVIKLKSDDASNKAFGLTSPLQQGWGVFSTRVVYGSTNVLPVRAS